MKQFLISIIILFCALCPQTANAQDKPLIHPFDGFGTLRNASDNGHWAVGAISSGEESADGSLVQLMDLITGQTVTLPLVEEQRGYGGSTFDVSNDGQTVAGSFNGYAAYYHDSRWHILPVPEGYEDYKGVAEYMSADGRWMIGYLFNSTWDIVSMLWKDGEIARLAGLSDSRSAKYFRVSGDGRKVFLNNGGRFCIYDTEEDTYETVAYRLGSNDMSISNNGRYVAGFKDITEYNGGEWPSAEYTVSFLYDTETKEYKEFSEEEDRDIAAVAVGNDGTLYGASPMYPPMRTLYVRSDNGWIALETMLRQKYGMSFTSETGFDYSGTVMSVCDDNRTLAAFSLIGGPCYSLTLPEPFREAANSINLLSAYSISPEEGSEVARMNSVSLTFDRKVSIVPDAKAYLYRDGETVATTLSISATEGNDKKVRLAFGRNAYLEPGIIHTLTIPAGTFFTDNKNVENPEINIKYMGRAYEPVKMTETLPSSGSSVAELSYYNMVMIQLDASASVSEGAQGELYKSGTDEPIAKMSLTAVGKQLYAYPATTQKLMRGTDYTIRIPAGSVTDVMGYCANEAIEINYSGAFVIETSDNSDEYIFFDNFSNPNNSVSNFLLYDGDHLSPTAEMQEFGFMEENTPWNFTIHDDGEYDYCAASHSCYLPYGASDDWMVIPQQLIANEHYYLTFKSQSYRNGCNDRLKVYVWVHDEYLSSLSGTETEAIRKEGKLIYDEEEQPGSSEENLEGDWREHRLSLAEFEGQRIYIAFVNENEGQSMVFVDDIGIMYSGNIQASNHTADIAVAQASMEISGNVRILNGASLDKITVSYLSHDKTAGDTLDIIVSDPDSTSYDFVFPKRLPLTIGKQTGYDIVVTAGNEKQTITSYIKNVAFLPEKRIIIEEGTGSWCGNCPLGTLAIEYLERMFPDAVIPVCIHNGDVYAFDDYCSFLGFSAYPTGKVNRLDGYLAPMVSDSYGNYAFMSETGDQTFADIFIKEMETLAEAEIHAGRPEYDDMTGQVGIPVTTRFAIDIENGAYNILTVILEDSLYGVQSNYFSNQTDPNLGEWQAGGTYGSSYTRYSYTDVARACAGLSFYGQSGFIPGTIKCDTDIENTVVFSLPSSINNRKNVKFVCMLIDASTGKVVNADRVPLYEEDDNVADKIETVTQTAGMSVTARNGKILVGGTAEGVEVYTLQGVKVENEHLGRGIYVVYANGCRQKVLVK
ncbi:MAG: choice-of-anchor J domain-containing protein [Bacteroides sp.]|nr:choice-of-anchor J domain-containing protein [Roseburia sp.]MCM1346175.1 choice-of-anchor J domain-containing protein [Bacteroides sp.]MCM1421330.1 choice-of-anchor J domain-containing protein [Bacteroides sp.]